MATAWDKAVDVVCAPGDCRCDGWYFAYQDKRVLTCFAPIFVVLMIITTVLMPGWRESHQRVFLEDGYAEVKQRCGLYAYRLTLEIVGNNGTVRCRPHAISSPFGRQEFQECFPRLDSGPRVPGNNKTCECWASYSFLVDHSTAKGDGKAAAMWREYRKAGTFVSVAIGGVLPAVAIVGGIFLAAAVCGRSPFPWDIIGASLFTEAFCLPIVTLSVWLSLTDFKMCFDESNSSLEGARCPAAFPPYWMICWSCGPLGALVSLLWWCVAASRREANRRAAARAIRPSAGHLHQATPAVSVSVVGKATNAQDPEDDGGDDATVTTVASTA